MTLANLWNNRETERGVTFAAEERLKRYRAMLRLAGAEVELRNRVIRALTTFTYQTSQMTEPAALLKLALSQAIETTKAQMGAIVLINPETQTLTLGAHKDLSPDLVRIFTGRQFDVGAATLMPHLVSGKGALLERHGTTDAAEQFLLETAAVNSLVSLPLQTGHQVLGALVVGIRDAGRFMPADLHGLLAIAQVTAVAWDAIHLRENLWHMAENLLSQESSSQANTINFNPTIPTLPPLQAKLANLIADLGGTMGAIFMLDETQISLAADYGLSPLFTSSYAALPRNDDAFPFTQLTQRDLLVKSVVKANSTFAIPMLKNLEEEGARSLIAVYCAEKDQMDKVFLVASSATNAFTSAHIDPLYRQAKSLLPLLTDLPRLPTFPVRRVHVPSMERLEATEDDLEQLLAAVMEAEEEVELHNRDFTSLNAISENLNRSLHLQRILPEVLTQIHKMLQVDAAWLYLVQVDDHPCTLTLTGYYGLSEEYTTSVTHLSLGDGPEGRMAKDGKPVVWQDTAVHGVQCQLLRERAGIQALAAVPLRRPDDEADADQQRVIGILAVGMQQAWFWQPRQIRLLTTVANQMAFAVNNARLYGQVQEHLSALAASNEMLHKINLTLMENPINVRTSKLQAVVLGGINS